MKADLSNIIKITGAKLELNNEISLNDAEFLGETYRFNSPLIIKGDIHNNGQSLTLTANVHGTMVTECSRCLDDIEVEVDFDISECLSRSDEGADKEGDVILFEGYEIELDDIVTDHFLMNISGRYLCSDDCKGLCPNCGHNLNEGDCGCNREVIDPRWQALADIMNQQD